ncbi:MAG: hypothetical protein CL949_25080 [Erythrobacter sp.]|mgnify:CR=1 FL=1|nr:hypothetical protein [Erythrobacter sp.]|tara:strand:- start:1149 stop:1487 length:339 start_codon:yes stop_codon:yes gene_type:complete
MNAPARFGHIGDDAVHIDCWLTIHPGDSRNWNRRPSVKLTAGEPALSRGERGINVRLTLPLALFEAPSIVARINVAAPTAPVTIDASAVADAVKSAIGMDVDVRVANPGIEP